VPTGNIPEMPIFRHPIAGGRPEGPGSPGVRPARRPLIGPPPGGGTTDCSATPSSSGSLPPRRPSLP
jgi:hypothetical protein